VNRWLAAAIIAGAAAAGLLLGKGRERRAAPPPARRDVAVAEPRVAPAVVAAARPAAAAPAPPERAAPAGTPVVIKPDQVVARVNGAPITGRQLVAFRAAGPEEQTMTPEMFDFLHQRAIERELVLQEARARGVELAPPQLAQLEAVRRDAARRGVTDPAEVDFEVNDARAGLLEAALLARAGAAAPAANDADVDRYLQEHAGADRARARQQLADEAQARYQERRRAYLDELAAAARITD
jgi:hypothetical protein